MQCMPKSYDSRKSRYSGNSRSFIKTTSKARIAEQCGFVDSGKFGNPREFDLASRLHLDHESFVDHNHDYIRGMAQTRFPFWFSSILYHTTPRKSFLLSCNSVSLSFRSSLLHFLSSHIFAHICSLSVFSLSVFSSRFEERLLAHLQLIVSENNKMAKMMVGGLVRNVNDSSLIHLQWFFYVSLA